MLSQKLSIEEKILKLLAEPVCRYKGISVNIIGLPTLSLYKKQSINNAVYRLTKNGYVSKNSDSFILLPKGRKYIENKKMKMVTFESPFKKNSPKNLLVMFDIPEDKKSEREWFRFQLRQFGYTMIQKSVWVGPSPLPNEFLDYTKKLNLKKCIKTFKLEKPYNTQL